jgi:16S rRNA (uracil1498-N3)-methyltransferase
MNGRAGAGADRMGGGVRSAHERWCAAEDAAAHVFAEHLGDTCTIDGSDGHHLQRVRRLAPGESVTVADGAGSWRRYDVTAAAAGRLELAAVSPVWCEPSAEPHLSIAIALLKGGLEPVVARCTELGVDRIEPLQTRRTVVRWDDRRAATALARLRTAAREASMQSRRARIPEVRPVAPIATLADRAGLVVADRAGEPVTTLPRAGPGGWTVVVGPEGGLAPEDWDAVGPSVARVAVGPHVLRAETAPVAVLAAFRSAVGPRM